MKYVMLIHQGDSPTPLRPERWAEVPADEQARIAADYQAINQTPGVEPGAGLQLPETATTVRVEDGRTLTTDGPVRGDQGGARRLLPLRGRRPRRGDRAGGAGAGGAARRRGGDPARPGVVAELGDERGRGVPRGVGSRPRRPDRHPRRLRARRGGRPGGVRDRRRALAARGRPVEPGQLAGDDGAQPGDRRAAPAARPWPRRRACWRPKPRRRPRWTRTGRSPTNGWSCSSPAATRRSRPRPRWR